MHTRLTLHLGEERTVRRLTEDKLGVQDQEVLEAELLTPLAPAEQGLYWGYTTRIANGLSDVFASCPYEVRGNRL